MNQKLSFSNNTRGGWGRTQEDVNINRCPLITSIHGVLEGGGGDKRVQGRQDILKGK